MKRILSLFMATIIAVIAFAGDTATAVFTVSPAMHCQNCENKIKSNIRFVKGVKEISTSIENQQVTVKYDSAKTNPEAIVKALDKIGYKASTAKTKADCCGKKEAGCCGGNGGSCCGAKK